MPEHLLTAPPATQQKTRISAAWIWDLFLFSQLEVHRSTEALLLSPSLWWSDTVTSFLQLLHLIHLSISTSIHPTKIQDTRTYKSQDMLMLMLMLMHVSTTNHSCFYFLGLYKSWSPPLSISRRWHGKMAWWSGAVWECGWRSRTLSLHIELLSKQCLKLGVPPQTFQSFIVLRRQQRHGYWHRAQSHTIVSPRKKYDLHVVSCFLRSTE